MSQNGEPRFVAVAKSSEVPERGARAVELGRRTIALFRYGARLFALDDMCPHSGGPLSEGEVEDGRDTCPWHGARFALDGGCSESPIAENVRCHRVRERDGVIEIETSDPDPATRA
jgi:nitrite reductase/ring-hydroxylating ferredoxin subunit